MFSIDPCQKFVPPGPLKIAVLFLIFNRPDVTKEVFEAIRQAQPPRLYIAADGPRHHRIGEIEKCEETRKIIGQIDWPCQIKTLFRTENLGCKRAVSSAITWFFEQEEEGIILEDDCLPAQSFFWYCQELLERYRHDERIGQIAGTCFFKREGLPEINESIIYSKYGPIWGWASWRRAWQHYDPELTSWSNMIAKRWFFSAYPTRSERSIKLKIGKKLLSGKLDTWDYQWGFTKSFYSMLSIIPTTNLIRNIGFGTDATHTTMTDSKAPTQASDITLPLSYPKFLLPDAQYERIFSRHAFPGPVRSKISRVLSLFKRAFH